VALFVRLSTVKTEARGNTVNSFVPGRETIWRLEFWCFSFFCIETYIFACSIVHGSGAGDSRIRRNNRKIGFVVLQKRTQVHCVAPKTHKLNKLKAQTVELFFYQTGSRFQVPTINMYFQYGARSIQRKKTKMTERVLNAKIISIGSSSDI